MLMSGMSSSEIIIRASSASVPLLSYLLQATEEIDHHFLVPSSPINDCLCEMENFFSGQ